MKYIKLFENFEEYKGLPSDQEEDLREIFFEFVSLKNFTPEEAWEYFQPKSQTFADFLTKLEEETDWFDYTQMDEIFQEISLYIEEDMKDDDGIDWADDDEKYNQSEGFEYPRGRQEEIKNTILDAFEEISDFEGVNKSVDINGDNFTLSIHIPELLQKWEIQNLYNNIIEPKIGYLSEMGIHTKKYTLSRIGNMLHSDGWVKKYYKDMIYEIHPVSVDITIYFKRFKST